MELSIGLRRSINLLKLDNVKDKIFADLMAIGYKDVDAFNIAHPEYMALSEAAILKMCKEKQVEKKFSAYFEKQKARYKRAVKTEQKEREDFEALSDGALSQVEKYKDKDFLIKALAVQAELCRDPKKKAEILMKIADLQNMKKEEVKEDHKYLTFYMPLTCNNCEIKALVEQRKAKIRELTKENDGLRSRLKRFEDTGEVVEEAE